MFFSPLFVILGFAKADAASASLFLNLVAAASAAYTYSKKRMVDFSLAAPLIISSALMAPVGAYLNARVDTRPFMMVLALVLVLAGARTMSSRMKGKSIRMIFSLVLFGLAARAIYQTFA